MRKFKFCSRIGLMFFLISLSFSARADEGMWLPILLSEGPEAEMQRLGMKITAEDIYSVNKPSIKDAVVLFGGGCTADIDSESGLILTNHHCGYSAIQANSTVEKDYLTNGFWAQTLREELPNPGLKASIIVRMTDVSEIVFQGLGDDMSPEKKEAIIRSRIDQIIAEEKLDKGCEARIRPFYYGNQFILIISKIFRDVRLVGAPPSSIGKFGGDTDNWMWPRHTGDFSVFRIYVGSDNEPADYDESNIPYKPSWVIPVSLAGVKENDFTFVYGFPGNTQEYLVSYAVDRIVNYENPASVLIRGTRLSIFRNFMQHDKKTRLQYAAKYASVENYYKKMMGESKGVKRAGVIEKKAEQERLFDQWVNADETRRAKYGYLLGNFEKQYSEFAPYSLASEYLFEACLGIEIVKYGINYFKIIELSRNKKKTDQELADAIAVLKNSLRGFFKNYNPAIDREVCKSLLAIYYRDCDRKLQVPYILEAGDANQGDFSKWTDEMFATSLFTDEGRITKFLDRYKPADYVKLESDPVYKLSIAVYSHYNNVINPHLNLLDGRIQKLYKVYIQALMEMSPDKKFYPDANSTLRVAYGQVKGYKPSDAVEYNYFTTAAGILQKEDTSIYDYRVDRYLKQIINEAAYGRYAESDGTLRVCFVATNHTTGGNSGSPVFNAKGELIGLNFDRVWEGTMSDISYNPAICRNVVLDIRYCLFIIEKFSGSTRLTDEMKLLR